MFREDKYILISSFIDKELTDKEKDYVQDKIENDPEWKSIYDNFLENKNSFVELKGLSFDNKSKETIMAKIGKKKDEEEYNSSFLPFPKRYIPAMAAFLVAAIVFTFIYIIGQQSETGNFFDRNRAVTKNYQENIFTNDNLYPFNASLNNEDIFRFAAFGIVSSESQKDQYVQIGDDDKTGLFVKIADERELNKNKMDLQLSEMFKKLNIDETQQKKIENVLDSYKENIETALLTTPDNSLAVDPYVWVFRQSLASDLVSELSENQKKEMDVLFSSYSGAFPKHENMVAVINYDTKSKRGDFNRLKARRDFIVITSDTLVVENIEINYDSIRHNAKYMKGKRLKYSTELNKLKSNHRELIIDMRIMNKINKKDTANQFIITFNPSNEGYIGDMNFKDKVSIETFTIDENFKKRMESYESMMEKVEKQYTKYHQFQQQMQKLGFKLKDSTNKYFNKFQIYRNNNRPNKMPGRKELNEKMIIDSAFYNYFYLQKDSINKLFNILQFSDSTDINISFQKLQGKGKHLRFYDTSGGKRKRVFNIQFNEND